VRGVMLQLVRLHASAAPGDERSVYGARLVSSGDTLDLSRSVVEATRMASVFEDITPILE
jgi:hypothetical protein